MLTLRIVADQLHIATDQAWYDYLIAGLTPVATIVGLVFIARQVRIAAEQTRIAADQARAAADQTKIALDAHQLAVAQAKEEQEWKKAEYIANQVADFFADEQCARVVYEIDWRMRVVAVQFGANPPVNILFVHDQEEKTSEETDDNADIETKQYFDSGHFVVLADALKSEGSNSFTDWEMCARDDIDHFLNRFGRFQHLIDAGLFSFEEIEVHMKYVLDMLCGRKDHVSKTLVAQLEKYIANYDFTGAASLMAESKRRHSAPT
jgi:hypothetical protein